MVEKWKNFHFFETLFYFLKLDINKCPKTILEKKFVKTKTSFFQLFFETLFSIFLTLNDNAIFYKNCTETIIKKVKKTDFF